MWLAERTHNPNHFPPVYMEGVDDGIWWAMVTAATVGYGDLYPITPGGRVIGMVYFIVGIAMFAILLGHISVQFLTNRAGASAKTTPTALAGERVCGNSHVLDSVLFNGVPIVKMPAATMYECGEMLKIGVIDAVVYDTPMLLYWRGTDAWAQQTHLEIGHALSYPPVGVAFPEKNLDHQLDTIKAELIDFVTSEVYPPLIDRWFPAKGISGPFGGEPLEWPVIGSAMGMVAGYLVLQVLLFSRAREKRRSTQAVV